MTEQPGRQAIKYTIGQWDGMGRNPPNLPTRNDGYDPNAESRQLDGMDVIHSDFRAS